MAKAKTEAYDPQKLYTVRLRRPVTLHGIQFLPIQTHDMTGALVSEIAPEDIADVQPAAV